MLILLALVLQDDWSGWRLERTLDESERVAIRERLAERLRATGVEELSALAEALAVINAVERPVYRMIVATLVESRRVEVVWTPTDEARRSARGSDVDAWKPPTPSHGSEGGSWAIAVPESEQVVDCTECSGAGKDDCEACAASGTRPCKKCRAKGEENHGPCNGTGKINCTTCGGDGRRGMGSSRTRCTWCSGSGKKDCGSCPNGKVKCALCKGRKHVDCADCDGDGEQTCERCKGKGRLRGVAVIRITIAADNSPELFTRLKGAPPAASSEWVSVDRADFAVQAARIPDEELRNGMLAHASRARTSAAPVRGQRVALCRVVCVEVEYEVDRVRYVAAVTATGVASEDWPGARWAAAKAFEAGAKLEKAGRDARGAPAGEAVAALPARRRFLRRRVLRCRGDLRVARRPSLALVGGRGHP